MDSRRRRGAAGELPVGVEDVEERAGEGGRADAHAHLEDVRERPPVEVLTADERVLAVDDEVLGVEHAAGEARLVEEPHRRAVRAEPLERRRVGLGELGIGEEAHLHAAGERLLYCRHHRREAALRELRLGVGLARVELGEVDRPPRARDHRRPDLGRVGNVRMVERRLDGRRLDERHAGGGAPDRLDGGSSGLAGGTAADGHGTSRDDQESGQSIHEFVTKKEPLDPRARVVFHGRVGQGSTIRRTTFDSPEIVRSPAMGPRKERFMHRTIRRLTLLALLFVTVAGATAAWAQGVTGSALTGTINAPDGKPLPNAHVQLRNTTTGEVFYGTTDADGVYFIDNVPPGGPYTVSAAAEGFPPVEQADLQLELGQRLELDLAMAPPVEEKVEQIQVQRRVDRLNDHGRTGASTTVGQNAISHLPLQGRNFTDLTAVSPLANGNSGGSSIGGQNNRYNNIQIDGGANNDLFGLANSGTPGGQTNAKPISIEAMKEFVIQIAPFDVRQSGFVGGLVNAITKSGTNDFHGSAFTYYQNKTLSNTSFIDPTCKCTKDDPTFLDFHTWQFGGSVGGPIIEDKLHFFVAADLQEQVAVVRQPFQITGDPNADHHSRRASPTPRPSASRASSSQKYGITNAGDALAPDPRQPGPQRLRQADLLGRRAQPRRAVVQLRRRQPRHAHPLADRAVLPASLTAAGNLRDGYQLSNSGYTQANTTHTIRVKLTSNWGDVSNEALAGVSIIRDNAADCRTRCRSSWSRSARSAPPTRGSPPAASASRTRTRSTRTSTRSQDNVTFGLGDHRLTVGTSNEFLQHQERLLPGRLRRGLGRFDSLDAFEAGTASRVPAPVRRERLAGSGHRRVQRRPARALRAGRVAAPQEPHPHPRLPRRRAVPARAPTPTRRSSTTPRSRSTPARCPSGNLLWSPRLGFNWDVEGNADTIVRGGAGLFTGRPPVRLGAQRLQHQRPVAGRSSPALASMGGTPGFTVDPNNQPSHLRRWHRHAAAADQPGRDRLLRSGHQVPAELPGRARRRPPSALGPRRLRSTSSTATT